MAVTELATLTLGDYLAEWHRARYQCRAGKGRAQRRSACPLLVKQTRGACSGCLTSVEVHETLRAYDQAGCV